MSPSEPNYKIVEVRFPSDVYEQLREHAEAIWPVQRGRGGGVPHMLKVLGYRALGLEDPNPHAAQISPRKVMEWFWLVSNPTGSTLRIGLDARVGSWIVRSPPHLPHGLPGSKTAAPHPERTAVAFGTRPFDKSLGVHEFEAETPREAFETALDICRGLLGADISIYFDGGNETQTMLSLRESEAVDRARIMAAQPHVRKG